MNELPRPFRQPSGTQVTSSTMAARKALKLAGALRGLLRELFCLSTSQMEALERNDLEGLEVIAGRKSELLEALPIALEAIRAQNWNLHDPTTYPVDGACSQILTEAADLSRRLQIHEKYVLGQLVARKNQVGDRLDSILNKRNAAAGYRVPRTRGRSIDKAS
jgi:hypothetical protein